MNKSSRVIVCAVMVILIAVTWFYINGQDKNKVEKQTFDSVIEKYNNLKKIVYVKVSDGQRTEALFWDDKFWRWEDKPNLSAPQDELTKSLEKVENKLYPQRIEQAMSTEEAGISEGSYAVFIRDEEGNELAIQIGKTNENGAYYVQLDGSEEIYTIRRYAKKMVDEIIVFRMMIDYDINSSPSYIAPY